MQALVQVLASFLMSADFWAGVIVGMLVMLVIDLVVYSRLAHAWAHGRRARRVRRGR